MTAGEAKLPAAPPAKGVVSLRQAGRLRRYWGLALAALCGPGLIVMLADTDAGSVITAAQSGAQWGYGMILPQLLLVPVLYVVQEMTVRLGILTRCGHGALIRGCFGPWWALLSAGTLFLSSVGALITEFAAVAGVGEMFGVSRWLTIPVATAFLVGLSLTGSYRRAERIGIAIGLAELAFIPAMIMSHPSLPAVTHSALTPPVGNSGYLYLLAANVGAVIMPWMIFYQQGAVIDKGLGPGNLRGERRATAAGALLTQVIMLAVVILLAATVGRSGGGGPLNSVGQISAALRPYLGPAGAKVLAGGGRATGPGLSSGFYMQPTVLEGVDPKAEISGAELFGPIPVIYRVPGFEAAIALANASPYGLTAAIHTRDVDRALTFVDRIETGVAVINAGTHGSEPHMPFGGVKASGNGTREPGTEALDIYSELRDVYVNVRPERA